MPESLRSVHAPSYIIYFRCWQNGSYCRMLYTHRTFSDSVVVTQLISSMRQYSNVSESTWLMVYKALLIEVLHAALSKSMRFGE